MELVTIIWQVIFGVFALLLIVLVTSWVYSRTGKKTIRENVDAVNYANEYRKFIKEKQLAEKINTVRYKRNSGTNTDLRYTKSDSSSKSRSKFATKDFPQRKLRFVVVNENKSK